MPIFGFCARNEKSTNLEIRKICDAHIYWFLFTQNTQFVYEIKLSTSFYINPCQVFPLLWKIASPGSYRFLQSLDISKTSPLCKYLQVTCCSSISSNQSSALPSQSQRWENGLPLQWMESSTCARPMRLHWYRLGVWKKEKKHSFGLGFLSLWQNKFIKMYTNLWWKHVYRPARNMNMVQMNRISTDLFQHGEVPLCAV